MKQVKFLGPAAWLKLPDGNGLTVVADMTVERGSEFPASDEVAARLVNNPRIDVQVTDVDEPKAAPKTADEKAGAAVQTGKAKDNKEDK